MTPSQMILNESRDADAAIASLSAALDDMAISLATAQRAEVVATDMVPVPRTSLEWLCRRGTDLHERGDVAIEAISMAQLAIPEYAKQLRDSERSRQEEAARQLSRDVPGASGGTGGKL